jgi:Na+-transporting methylmalonyl-CoA/oxaloacetate decarboxylase gamma subunit
MISAAVFGVGVLVSALVAWAMFQIGRIESQLVAQEQAERAAAEQASQQEAEQRKTTVRFVA